MEQMEDCSSAVFLSEQSHRSGFKPFRSHNAIFMAQLRTERIELLQYIYPGTYKMLHFRGVEQINIRYDRLDTSDISSQ